ncbi:dienelactone hydrolase family protein [Sphingomonas sp.]|uniref:dienelactone hydrolase family protein n=1 Tax=Sphingomonas sp. TaxID=28214 RepID=UPI003B3B5DF2
MAERGDDGPDGDAGGAGATWRPGRRTLIAGAAALAALPAVAARHPKPPKAPPPPKTANIRWPGPGHDLHGYMAIPAKAHGPQPAVLVVHDAGGADPFTRGLCDQLAAAGFVACAPIRLASLEEAVATVHWLASNAYATGKVAGLGLGWGASLLERVAASPQPQLTAMVTFSADRIADLPVPALHLQAVAQLQGEAYAQAWQQTLVFLKDHLA